MLLFGCKITKIIRIIGYTDYRKCYQFYRKKFAVHYKNSTKAP